MDTVERKVISSGGYYTIGTQSYWFPADEYKEAQDKDFSMPLTAKGDRDFSEWLIKFAEDHNLKPSLTTQNTRTLAAYWTKPVHKSALTTDTNTIKFASVLKAMRSVIGVVDPSHKLTVSFSNTPTSYWDNGTNVYLPAEPVLNIEDTVECVNTEAGFAIHEAFHSIETRRILDDSLEDYLHSSKLKRIIVNIMEDVRIEDVLLRETPGYKEYLKYTMEYLFSDGPLVEYKVWDRGNINSKLNAVLLWTRYEDRDGEYLQDPSFEESRTFVKDWIRGYLQAQAENPTGLTAVEWAEKLRKWLGPMDESTVFDVPLPCMAKKGGAPDGLSIEKAIEEESELHEADSKGFKDLMDVGAPMRTSGNAQMNNVLVTKPLLGDAKYRGSKGNMIAKAKASLSFRKTQVQHDTRLQKQGIIDEDEIYRVLSGDMRIFKDAQVESQISAAVYLLVDLSGSMSGSKIQQATMIAQVFAESLAHNPAIKVKVLGHTGDNLPDESIEGGLFYRIWESGEDLNRLGLLATLDKCENYDSWAIAWAGKMLLEENVDQRLLVVLSDGQPQAMRYGGPDAQEHVRQVTDALGRKGVFTVQVAVGDDVSPLLQDRMFKHWINASAKGRDTAFNLTVKQLTQLLRRKML